MLSFTAYDTMKQESHDDGYETCGDLDLRSQLGKEPKFTDFHAHVHVHQHSELDPSLSLQGKAEQSKYFSSTPVEAPAQASKMEHKFVDFHNSLQSPAKEHKFIDYQDSATSYSVKCGGVGSVPPNSDPYNFGEDERLSHMPNAVVPVMAPVPVPAPPPAPVPAMIPQQPQCSSVFPPQPKKRGRKRKIRPGEEGMDGQLYNPLSVKDEKLGPYKERKKHDRFNGMPEEEVQKRTLPDHLTPNLDIIIIGINPGLFAAYKGHHYAGPGNHFWKCLYLSGLTPEPMTADDDYKLLNVGIGFTNMVERATKGSADLTRKEIKRGSQILLEKLQKFKPKIAVFNGKLIYEVFSGKKDFYFGRQPDFVDGTNTYMWVMPSSSARCAQLPRAADKVPFYAALKKFRDYLNGVVSDFDESEVVFTSSKLKHYYEPEVKDDPDEKYPYGYPPRLPGGDGTTEMGHPMIKQEDGTTIPGEQIPVKKKRGRPKKIKSDNPDEVVKTCESTKKKAASQNDDAPKKKRGRPKKIKEEDGGSGGASGGGSSGTDTVSNMGVPNSMSSFNQHMSMNHCPQPPFSQASFNHMMGYNHSTPHTPYHHFSHSPQPASLTHSDLSSEISAAISSEHNLASPSPHSPHLGPGPTSSDYDSGGGLSGDVKASSKAEGANGPPSGGADCGFHSEEGPSGYQGYSNFPSGNGEHSHLGHPGMPPYPQHPAENINQDVSAKSLSGLESLVDQIPSIADNGGPHSTSVNEGGPDQYSGPFEDSSFMGAYPGVPQHYSGGYDSGYNTGIRMNFSVTSLPNAPSPGGAGTPNAFPNYSPPSSGSGSGSGSAPYSMPLGPGMHHGMDAHRMMGRIFNGGCDMSLGMGMNYSYNQYGSSGGGSNPGSAASGSGSGSGSGSYPGSPSSSTPGSGGSGYYSPSHPLHMPSPNYPSPYFPSSPYAQQQVGYSMTDRGKQDSDLGTYNGSGF